MNCSNCNKSIPSESKFCMFCGTEIQSNVVEDSKTPQMNQVSSKGGETKEDTIERYGFGVLTDSDEIPHFFSHSDQFLIIDLKNRKEVIFEEYRTNPHGETCRTKYTRPACLGERPSDEERQIYQDIAEMLTDCKYVIGGNLGYAPKMAMEKADVFYIMQSVPELPHDHIDRLIENRAYAGFRD